MSDSSVVAVLQSALAAENAAIYGYGVLGAHLPRPQRDLASAAYSAHRARRDRLQSLLRDRKVTPSPGGVVYALPTPVIDAASAVTVAALLEDGVAGAYADLVAAADSADLRREAALALREDAVRAARWRGSTGPFPGLGARLPTIE